MVLETEAGETADPEGTEVTVVVVGLEVLEIY